MTKLFAAMLVGAVTVFGPVAQAEKNDSAIASNAIATRIAAAMPTSSANAAEMNSLADMPGVTARDMGDDREVQKPEPTVAWLLALGFLGLVVLRRTRSGPMV